MEPTFADYLPRTCKYVQFWSNRTHHDSTTAGVPAGRPRYLTDPLRT